MKTTLTINMSSIGERVRLTAVSRRSNELAKKMLGQAFKKNLIQSSVKSFNKQMTMKSILAVALCLASFCFVMPASGGTVGSDEKWSSEKVGLCHDFASCKEQGLALRVLMSERGVAPEVAGLLAQISEVMRFQVDMWSDTILEGDYDAEGAPVLDRIEGIYDQNVQNQDRLIAFRITYSARAWKLDENGNRGAEGHISEASFVGVGFKSFFRDEFAPATFLSSVKAGNADDLLRR